MASRATNREISVRILTAQRVILVVLASSIGCGASAPNVIILSQDTTQTSADHTALSDIFSDSDGTAPTDIPPMVTAKDIVVLSANTRSASEACRCQITSHDQVANPEHRTSHITASLEAPLVLALVP